MKRFDTKNKTPNELTNGLTELREKLAKLRFDKADKKLKDSSQFGKIRKDIARIMTALNNS